MRVIAAIICRLGGSGSRLSSSSPARAEATGPYRTKSGRRYQTTRLARPHRPPLRPSSWLPKAADAAGTATTGVTNGAIGDGVTAFPTKVVLTGPYYPPPVWRGAPQPWDWGYPH
jgi:hypothetical protein